MSLQNGVYKLLNTIGLSEGDFPRFRFIKIIDNKIKVVTASGGRNAVCSSIHTAMKCDDDQLKHDTDCVVTKHAALRRNPFYLFDEDKFDTGTTLLYRNFVFKLPD